MRDCKRKRVSAWTERPHREIRCNRLDLNYRKNCCNSNNGRCNETHFYSSITATCIHSRYDSYIYPAIVFQFLLKILRSQTSVIFRGFSLSPPVVGNYVNPRDSRGVHKIAQDGTLRCGNHNRILVSVSVAGWYPFRRTCDSYMLLFTVYNADQMQPEYSDSIPIPSDARVTTAGV